MKPDPPSIIIPTMHVNKAPYQESDLLSLSLVEEYSFCPRRCGLKLIEQAWDSNAFTAEGSVLHERAHSGKNETRAGVRVTRSLRLRSFHLGVTGIADVVEFCAGVPFPIEYKRGAAQNIHPYEIQLCAQALCLEEMLGVAVPSGAIFFGAKQHRHPVEFTLVLRRETEAVCAAIHTLLATGATPAPCYSKRCQSCSLFDACLPNSLDKSACRYLSHNLASISIQERMLTTPEES